MYFLNSDAILYMSYGKSNFSYGKSNDSVKVNVEFSSIKNKYKVAKIPMAQADVTMIPQTWTSLSSEQDIKSMNRILDLLDEDDDVQEVYHNWDE